MSAARLFRLLLTLLLVCCFNPAVSAQSKPNVSKPIAVSSTGVIEAGNSVVYVLFNLPACDPPQRFLLKNIHVGPELENGGAFQTVLQLPPWGVSAIVHQEFDSGVSISHPVTMIADGPTHVSASVPGGQGFGGQVTIQLLGTTVASSRFQFNVHVTGECGLPSVVPAS